MVFAFWGTHQQQWQRAVMIHLVVGNKRKRVQTESPEWFHFVMGVLLRSAAVAVNCENVKLVDSLSPAGLASLTGPVAALPIKHCIHPQ